MNIFLAELLGTMLLVLLGNGVVANVLLSKSKGHNSGWIVISAGWGFAVIIAVYVMGWVSGGHINPAVTIAFASIGKCSWSLVPLYLSGQMIGAMIGALLVWLSYTPHWKATPDASLKLLCFCTKPAIYKPVFNFLTETLATAVLLLGILGIINPNNGVSEASIPYLVGILVFSIGLSLGGPTGYAINPARDLSPRIIHALFPIPGKGKSDWGYSWIPTFAPIIGGILGAKVYVWIFSS